MNGRNNGLYENFKDMIDNEWCYELNDIYPKTLTIGNHYKAWWKCPKCGCIWQAPIYNRTRARGCPQCKNSKSEKMVDKILDEFMIAHSS